MLINLLIDFVNFLIAAVGGILSFLFSVLPDTPFSLVDIAPVADFLGYLNYLLPVTEIVAILTVWCSAIGVYYIYQIVLRYVKVVE